MADVARRCAAIAITGLLVWAGTRSLPPRAQALPPTNVIFVLVDDLRFDAMGFMKHPWLETPHLDALARSGVHFRNAVVTTALCSPSRASILTGAYAHRHRVVDTKPMWVRNQRNSWHGVDFPYHSDLDIADYHRRYAETLLFETLGTTGGMFIPLSPDRGSPNSLRRRAGSPAAAFPPHSFAR